MSLFNSDFGCEKVAGLLSIKNAAVHLIGALGSGMSPIGTLLSEKGVTVTGYDRNMGSLRMPKGVVGSTLENSGDVTLAAYSLAISENDPEIKLAKKMGIPLVSRAELLGGIMLGYKRRIGVSGSHGKSTTTALLDLVFSSIGLRPTTVSGAGLSDGSPYHGGDEEIFLYEACEYKDSFLRTRPTDVIINNAELDHIDYFENEEKIKRSFLAFALSATGKVVIGDDLGIATSIYEKMKDRATLVGKREICDFKYYDVEFCDTGTAFSLKYGIKELGRFKIGLFGEYNVRNASSALALAYLLGYDVTRAKDALSSFSGIGRRGELLGIINGRAVYYDYAHHPTEMRELFSALKARYGAVSCVFSPHTYSRTMGLWSDFRDSLGIADHSVILDIYPAREDPIPGITSEELARAVGDTAVYLKPPDVIDYCIGRTKGAIALVGAGDIEDLKNEFTEYIKKWNNKED